MSSDTGRTVASSLPPRADVAVHFKLKYGELIRRFGLSRLDDNLFSLLLAKVHSIVGVEVDLFWKDEDSLIVLESNEDLDAAIDYAETQNKLACVSMVAEPKKLEKKEQNTSEVEVTAEASKAAFGGIAIQCDGCDCFLSPANGGRFKCTICFDYDLCLSCFVKQRQHRNHAFLWMADGNTELPPVLAPPGIGAGIVRARNLAHCTPSFASGPNPRLSELNDDLEKWQKMIEELESRLEKLTKKETKLSYTREEMEMIKEEMAQRADWKARIHTELMSKEDYDVLSADAEEGFNSYRNQQVRRQQREAEEIKNRIYSRDEMFSVEKNMKRMENGDIERRHKIDKSIRRQPQQRLDPFSPTPAEFEAALADCGRLSEIDRMVREQYMSEVTMAFPPGYCTDAIPPPPGLSPPQQQTEKIVAEEQPSTPVKRHFPSHLPASMTSSTPIVHSGWALAGAVELRNQILQQLDELDDMRKDLGLAVKEATKRWIEADIAEATSHKERLEREFDTFVACAASDVLSNKTTSIDEKIQRLREALQLISDTRPDEKRKDNGKWIEEEIAILERAKEDKESKKDGLEMPEQQTKKIVADEKPSTPVMRHFPSRLPTADPDITPISSCKADFNIATASCKRDELLLKVEDIAALRHTLTFLKDDEKRWVEAAIVQAEKAKKELEHQFDIFLTVVAADALTDGKLSTNKKIRTLREALELLDSTGPDEKRRDDMAWIHDGLAELERKTEKNEKISAGQKQSTSGSSADREAAVDAVLKDRSMKIDEKIAKLRQILSSAPPGEKSCIQAKLAILERAKDASERVVYSDQEELEEVQWLPECDDGRQWTQTDEEEYFRPFRYPDDRDPSAYSDEDVEESSRRLRADRKKAVERELARQHLPLSAYTTPRPAYPGRRQDQTVPRRSVLVSDPRRGGRFDEPPRYNEPRRCDDAVIAFIDGAFLTRDEYAARQQSYRGATERFGGRFGAPAARSAQSPKKMSDREKQQRNVAPQCARSNNYENRRPRDFGARSSGRFDNNDDDDFFGRWHSGSVGSRHGAQMKDPSDDEYYKWNLREAEAMTARRKRGEMKARRDENDDLLRSALGRELQRSDHTGNDDGVYGRYLECARRQPQTSRVVDEFQSRRHQEQPTSARLVDNTEPRPLFRGDFESRRHQEPRQPARIVDARDNEKRRPIFGFGREESCDDRHRREEKEKEQRRKQLNDNAYMVASQMPAHLAIFVLKGLLQVPDELIKATLAKYISALEPNITQQRNEKYQKVFKEVDSSFDNYLVRNISVDLFKHLVVMRHSIADQGPVRDSIRTQIARLEEALRQNRTAHGHYEKRAMMLRQVLFTTAFTSHIAVDLNCPEIVGFMKPDASRNNATPPRVADYVSYGPIFATVDNCDDSPSNPFHLPRQFPYTH